MMDVFELINEDDLVSLTCLITILYIVGANMANARIRLWGWRVAAVAYVVFVAYAFERLAPTSASELAAIAFRGLVAGGLTVGPVWIILAIVSFVYNGIPNLERRLVVPPTTPEPELSRVDRGPERQEQEERQRQQASDQAKCEELRLECELLYNRHANQLQAVIPPERFKELLDSYLYGQSDPQLVRKRTRMLKKLLTDHVSAAEASDKETFQSLRELAEHFATLRQEAQELPCDEDTRDSILTAVNKQEDDAIEAFLKRGDP